MENTTLPKQEQITRLMQAIDECNRFIAREAPRRADTRPDDVQKCLDQTIAHRAKLNARLTKLVFGD